MNSNYAAAFVAWAKMVRPGGNSGMDGFDKNCTKILDLLNIQSCPTSKPGPGRRTHMMVRIAIATLVSISFSTASADPLVVKNSDGKFLPAAATQWASAGEYAWRFMLQSGMNATDIAKKLSKELAPIEVKASDAVTIVFSGKDLTEQALLEKLSGIDLASDEAKGDALAALGELGSAGAPSMGDVSSAGSIRASKEIQLPQLGDKRRSDKMNIVGEVVGMEPCKPVPVFHIKVIKAPAEGKYKDAIKTGDTVPIRGYFAYKNEKKEIDTQDQRTRINMDARGINLGTTVFGKPFKKDGSEWVLETIEVY